MALNINDKQARVYSDDHQILKVGTSEHITTFSSEYTASAGAIASTTVLTPTTGYSLVIYSIWISTEATAGTLQFDFLTSVDTVYKSYFAKETAPSPSGMHKEGAVDEVLKISGTGMGATDKTFVIINYAEHNGS